MHIVQEMTAFPARLFFRICHSFRIAKFRQKLESQFWVMTRNVRSSHKKPEKYEVRQEKHSQNLWKSLWILCITYRRKLEKPGNCRIMQNLK